MRHEHRIVGHVSGTREGTERCICGNKWPCPEANIPEIKVGLLFREITETNWARALSWHAGAPMWSLSDWATALAGEVGEACNVIKKLNRIRDGIWKRGTDSIPVLKEKLAEELADAQMYLMILAVAAGVDLEEEVKKKFNKVSEKFGFPERL